MPEKPPDMLCVPVINYSTNIFSFLSDFFTTKQVDPYGDRTIGVLTKTDTLEAGTTCLDILAGRGSYLFFQNSNIFSTIQLSRSRENVDSETVSLFVVESTVCLYSTCGEILRFPKRKQIRARKSYVPLFFCMFHVCLLTQN